MTETDAVPATAPELLRQAAALIDQAAKELDTGYKRCADCRARVFHNYDHARVFEQLAAMPADSGARPRSTSAACSGTDSAWHASSQP